MPNKLTLTQKKLDVPAIDTRIIKIRKLKQELLIFEDFSVDGVSLSESIRTSEPSSPLLSTALGIGWNKVEKIKFLNRLLGLEKPDLPGGRVALYVCPFDGDLQCDCVGINIELKNETVTWSKFAWDGTYDDWSENDPYDEEDSVTPLKSLTKFTFDRKNYESLIRAELHMLDAR